MSRSPCMRTSSQSAVVVRASAASSRVSRRARDARVCQSLVASASRVRTYVFAVDRDATDRSFLDQTLHDTHVAAHDCVVQRRPAHLELTSEHARPSVATPLSSMRRCASRLLQRTSGSSIVASSYTSVRTAVSHPFAHTCPVNGALFVTHHSDVTCLGRRTCRQA